jgi:hypothetical protein
MCSEPANDQKFEKYVCNGHRFESVSMKTVDFEEETVETLLFRVENLLFRVENLLFRIDKLLFRLESHKKNQRLAKKRGKIDFEYKRINPYD